MTRHKTIHNKKYIELIDQLTAERRRLGLSQAEVAQELDITQSEVSKMETLERRLDVLEFQQLLAVYRVGENQKLKKLVVEFFSLDRI